MLQRALFIMTAHIFEWLISTEYMLKKERKTFNTKIITSINGHNVHILSTFLHNVNSELKIIQPRFVVLNIYLKELGFLKTNCISN